MNKSNKLIYILFTLILTFLFTINVNAEENSNESQIIFHLNTSTINFTKNETTKDINYNIKINVGNETLNNTTTAQGTMYTVSVNDTVLTDLHNSSNTIPVTLTNNKTSKYVSLRDELNSNGVINASINTNNKAAEYIGFTTINFQTHDYYMYKINFEIDGILYDSPEENMVLYDIKFGSNAIETDISTGLYRIRPLNEEITINNIRAQEGYEYIGNETVTSKIEGATVVTLRFNKIWNINYVLNDGILENSIDTYTYTDATFSLPTPTREGYTFTGWTGGKNIFYSTNYNKSTYSYGLPMFDDNEKIIINSQTANSINFTINYEKWKYVITNEYQLLPNTKYIISFHREDSNNYNQNRNYVYGINNEGEYEFLVNEGDGHMFITAKGDVSITFTTNSTGKTAFAWGIGTDGDGTTIDISNIQLEEGNINTIYEAYISTPEIDTTIPTNSRGNRTYIANWKKNEYTITYTSRDLIETDGVSQYFSGDALTSSTDWVKKENDYYLVHTETNYTGLRIDTKFTQNFKYLLEYDVQKIDGTLTNLGGHATAAQEQVFKIDDRLIEEKNGNPAYTFSTYNVNDDTNIHHVSLNFKYNYTEEQPYTQIFIQPNRYTGKENNVTTKISNVHLNEVFGQEIREYKSLVGEQPIPVKEGYKFIGWFTDPDDGVQITADSVVTKSMTLYPHYTRGDIMVCNEGNPSSYNDCDSYNDLAVAIANGNNKQIIFTSTPSTVNEITIPEGANINIDLGDYALNSIIKNNGNLNLYSSSGQGIVNSKLYSYNTSKTNFTNINVNATPHLYDTSIVNLNNINLNVNESSYASGIWLHNGKTNLYVNNSTINAPFGIGGEGGYIEINNSIINGTIRNGINVNQEDVSSDIVIKGNSTINGHLYGIYLYNNIASTIIIGDSSTDNITITGGDCGAINSRLLDFNTLYFNYGTLIGKETAINNFKTITRDNLPIKTESITENGITIYKQTIDE